MWAEAGGPAAWLAAQNPLWRQVGRVTFHLAENKRDAERPFAFLANYTHRFSEQAKPQYLPLRRALQEDAGAGNRAALLTLLAPVQRAAEQARWRGSWWSRSGCFSRRRGRRGRHIVFWATWRSLRLVGCWCASRIGGRRGGCRGRR